MKLGSLFDGIGGFPKIAQELGIEPTWASEIEPFPIKVTKARLPSMVHLGDVTKINGAEIEPVDIITGGSPCQDLSVAGKRAGLEGQRSGLFMEMIRIIKEMRNADKLRIERRRDTKIWDRNDTFIESGKAGVHSEYRNTNAISTGCGAGETADIEGRESQHGFCGTNQPLRPRFVVWENVPGAFSSNNGEDFRAVIEEMCKIADETVTIPRPAKGKWNTAGCVVGNGFSFAWRTIDAQFWGVPQRRRRIYAVLDIRGQSAFEIFSEPQSVPRHIAESRKARKGITTNAKRSIGKAVWDARGNGNSQVCCTLTSEHQNRVTDYTALCLQGSMIGRQDHNGQVNQPIDTVAGALNCMHDHQAVMVTTEVPRKYHGSTTEVVGALCSSDAKGMQAQMATQNKYITGANYSVRRLTPLECERLQGFPDYYTNIPSASDSARYKALGNSVALPCVRHVLGAVARILRG